MSIIHFFNEYLSNPFHILNMMFSTRDKIDNETEEIPALNGAYIPDN